MAFDKLHQLGEAKFQKILNALMRGQPAMHLARTLQQEWGDFQEVSTRTLTQQLNRLRIAAAEGAFGKNVAIEIAKGATPQIKMLEGLSTAAVSRLEELSNFHRDRVVALLNRERDLGPKKNVIASPALITSVNNAMGEYASVLKDLQKMRFDLGLDEFKGPVSGVKGAALSVTLPDGTTIQKQVFEAVTTLEQIFNKRKIPLPVQADL